MIKTMIINRVKTYPPFMWSDVQADIHVGILKLPAMQRRPILHSVDAQHAAQSSDAQHDHAHAGCHSPAPSDQMRFQRTTTGEFGSVAP